MTSYDQSLVSSLTCLTIALADSFEPDENSRFLRTLFVMTFTWDPPTSIVRMVFVGSSLFVRFHMMRYTKIDWRSSELTCSVDRAAGSLAVEIPHAQSSNG